MVPPPRATPRRLFLALLFASGGCAGGIGDPSPYYLAADSGMVGPSGDCDAPNQVFAQSCVMCHSPPSPLGALDLTPAGVAARLVGVPASLCTGEVLVVAGAPDASYLLQKIVDPQPACGSVMPQAAGLSSAAVACVEAWIVGLADGGAASHAGAVFAQ